MSILGWPGSTCVSTLHAHFAAVSRADSLLLLACPLGQLAQALPLTGRVSDRCVSHAQALLHNITATLAKVGNAVAWGGVGGGVHRLTPSPAGLQKELFSGIDCTKQSLELHQETQTASACSPKVPVLLLLLA